MEIVQSVRQMQDLSRGIRRQGRRVGLVPTMGALHEGHFSLLGRAQESTDISVLSIFVNPKQFGPKEDLAGYPRPFDADCREAQRRGCDIIFAPQDAEMYGPHHRTYVSVEEMTEKLCGCSRPGHFRGVTTVVLKLLNIVAPDVVVFGQKDAQQALVLRRMIADLDIPVEMVVAPTVRESDGLAMSSRNAYLTQRERSEAPVIFQGLTAAMQSFSKGIRIAAGLKSEVASIICSAQTLSPEYVEIVDTENLDPVRNLDGAALLAVACRTTESKTRLIDNIVLGGRL